MMMILSAARSVWRALGLYGSTLWLLYGVPVKIVHPAFV